MGNKVVTLPRKKKINVENPFLAVVVSQNIPLLACPIQLIDTFLSEDPLKSQYLTHHVADDWSEGAPRRARRGGA